MLFLSSDDQEIRYAYDQIHQGRAGLLVFGSLIRGHFFYDFYTIAHLWNTFDYFQDVKNPPAKRREQIHAFWLLSRTVSRNWRTNFCFSRGRSLTCWNLLCSRFGSDYYKPAENAIDIPDRDLLQDLVMNLQVNTAADFIWRWHCLRCLA